MYEIDQHTIHFSNGKKYRFPIEVAETLDFEDSIVVRLSANHHHTIHNIYALDYNGNLLWKVPLARLYPSQHPYVSLSRKGSYVEALNWDGHLLTLHPKEGYIVGEEFYSGGGSHSRRTASPRRWI